MNSQYRKHVVNVLDTISDKKIESLKKFLLDGTLSLISDTYELKNKLNLTSAEIILVKKLLNDFTNGESLIIALELLTEIKKIENIQEKTSSLVWTSPFIFHEKADNTLSMILEMINSAKKSITFVGYTIQGDTPEIFEALVNATKRGVLIKLLFDKAEEYLNNIKKNWQDRIAFPVVYTYKPTKKYSSLHAKFLIKDSREILVTSANLTSRAINRNVELGIFHSGKIAEDANELVESLVQNEYLVKLQC